MPTGSVHMPCPEVNAAKLYTSSGRTSSIMRSVDAWSRPSHSTQVSTDPPPEPAFPEPGRVVPTTT